MDDASPLVNYVYQTFCDCQISRFRANAEYHKSKSRMKSLGKKLVNMELFKLLYSESVVALPGNPLQNQYINWLEQTDEQKEMPRNVHFPSKHFEFTCLRRKLNDFKLPANDHSESLECSMSIVDIDSEAANSFLVTCCAISHVQEITDLWMQGIDYHQHADDMEFRLSTHTMSLTVIDCKLPQNLTGPLLAQLAICRRINEIYMSNFVIGDLAHFIPKAISSWKYPSLEVLFLRNCSIPEESVGEILKSLATCQHITRLNLSGNHVGASGKYLAEAIINWGDTPSLEYLNLNNCSIPEENCTEILRILTNCHNLKHLDLSENHVGASGKYIAEANENWGDAPSLQTLYLQNCSIPEESCIKILKTLNYCQNLQSLILPGNHVGASAKYLAQAIKSWGDAPSLQRLSLNNCSIPEESCSEIFKSLTTCQHITELDLSVNHVGASGKYLANAIRNWGDAPSLKTLYLENCSIPEESCCEIVKSLTTCQHITELDLSGNDVGASGKYLAEAIGNWGDVPSLKTLYLENCSLPEGSCCEILKSLTTCQHITHLSLSGNYVGASGKYLAKAITNWGDVPSLKALYLKNCLILEENCCEILKSLTTCQHMTHLSLLGNHVGTSGKYLAEAIKNWGNAPSLEYLNLENCSIPKTEWCRILQSLINLIGHQRLPKLNSLVLSENKLHITEDEVGKLLNTCLTKHQVELIVFLDSNEFSTGFINHWKKMCDGTRIVLVFEYD